MFIFIWLHEALGAAHGIFFLRCSLQDRWFQHAGSSCLTRDRYLSPCIESPESAIGPPGKSHTQLHSYVTPGVFTA